MSTKPMPNNDWIAHIYRPGFFPKKISVPSGFSGHLLGERREWKKTLSRRSVLIRRSRNSYSLLLVNQNPFSLEFEQNVITRDQYPYVVCTEVSLMITNVPRFVASVVKPMNRDSIEKCDLQSLLHKRVFAGVSLPEKTTMQETMPHVIAKVTAMITRNLLMLQKDFGIEMVAHPKVMIAEQEKPVLVVGDQILNPDQDITRPTWDWNADSRTLTLAGYHGSAISMNGNLTICLTEKTVNTITAPDTEGICVRGALQIKGSGSLLIDGANTATRFRGILADTITIEDAVCKVLVVSGGHAISAAERISISGATVAAVTKTDTDAAGIYAGVSVEIENSTVTVKGPYGIYSGDVMLYGGNFIAEGIHSGVCARNICTLVDANATCTGTALGILANKLEVRDSRILCSGKQAVSCTYEKIVGLPVRAGDSIDSMKPTSRFEKTRHISVGY